MWVGSASSVFSEKRFQDRVRLLSLIFGILYAVIVLRLFELQIIKGEDFAQLSESNRTQLVALRAPRGNFIDDKGKTLITNRPSWSLMYSTEDNQLMTRTEVEARLSRFLDPINGQWRKRLGRAYQS